MAGKKIKKLSWHNVEKSLKELGDKIKADGFAPDCIVGISAGGLVPLYYLAKHLGVKKILIFGANSYDKNLKRDVEINYLPEIDFSGKKVLIVDDIADTGDTLRAVTEAAANKYKIGEVKTAVIVLKSKEAFPADYWVKEHDEWIAFPWEKFEFPEYF